MRTFFWIIIGLLITIITLLGYSRYLNHHNIKVMHFAPTLTRNIPFLKRIDETFSVTSGINWYKVQDKITGRKYLFQKGFIIIPGKDWVDVYYIMDDIKRDKWIKLSRKDFRDRFGNMTEGEAFIEDGYFTTYHQVGK